MAGHGKGEPREIHIDLTKASREEISRAAHEQEKIAKVVRTRLGRKRRYKGLTYEQKKEYVKTFHPEFDNYGLKKRKQAFRDVERAVVEGKARFPNSK